MTDIRYRVVFKGEIAPDTKIDDVKLKVDFIFKTDSEKIKRLFSGEEVIVKKNATLEACEKVREAFKNAGAIAYIQEEKISDAGEVMASLPPPLPSAKAINEKQTINNRRKNRTDEKFCPSCGELIQIKSLHCPCCGAEKKKVGVGGWLLMGAIAIGTVIVFSITPWMLETVAIPYFQAQRESIVKSELMNLYTAEDAYYQTNEKFTDNLTELNFKTSESFVTVEIISADENCFEAKGEAELQKKPFWVDCTGEISTK
jgi:hypothetical protein